MAKGPIPKKVGEEWRLIEGETDFYVSNFGRVRKNNRLINQSINQDGYYSCWIGSGDSRKRKLVHRLVAQAFIPNPENKEAVDHIDGNKLNNRFSDDPDINNLRWVTNQENTQAAYEKGLIQRTEVVAIDPAEADSAAETFDAYYGDPSPMVPAFVTHNKPVMISDYDIF